MSIFDSEKGSELIVCYIIVFYLEIFKSIYSYSIRVRRFIYIHYILKNELPINFYVDFSFAFEMLDLEYLGPAASYKACTLCMAWIVGNLDI